MINGTIMVPFLCSVLNMFSQGEFGGFKISHHIQLMIITKICENERQQHIDFEQCASNLCQFSFGKTKKKCYLMC